MNKISTRSVKAPGIFLFFFKIPRWGIKYNSYSMIQWTLDGTYSLGIHIDPIKRNGDYGTYGPYIDFHLIFIAISIGNHPARANALSLLKQGGIMRPEGDSTWQ